MRNTCKIRLSMVRYIVLSEANGEQPWKVIDHGFVDLKLRDRKSMPVNTSQIAADSLEIASSCLVYKYVTHAAVKKKNSQSNFATSTEENNKVEKEERLISHGHHREKHAKRLG